MYKFIHVPAPHSLCHVAVRRPADAGWAQLSYSRPPENQAFAKAKRVGWGYLEVFRL